MIYMYLYVPGGIFSKAEDGLEVRVVLYRARQRLHRVPTQSELAQLCVNLDMNMDMEVM